MPRGRTGASQQFRFGRSHENFPDLVACHFPLQFRALAALVSNVAGHVIFVLVGLEDYKTILARASLAVNSKTHSSCVILKIWIKEQ
jgi:hypothetical protein